MAGAKLGGQAEEFERLLILAEEDKAQTPKAKEALADWRAKFTDYGAAMFFSAKQWDWLKSLAGEEEEAAKAERRDAPRLKTPPRRDRGNPEPDDDIPF